MDPARMTYVAGCNRKTVSGLEVMSPGEFRYRRHWKAMAELRTSSGCSTACELITSMKMHGDLARMTSSCKRSRTFCSEVCISTI